MSFLAITVVGPDRPGIIARSAEILAGAGMNLEDSSMTLLRGHFAMTLICAGEADATDVETSLAPIAADGLSITVRELAHEIQPADAGTPYLLTVHGADRLGIVAELTTLIADAGGNITDLTTRLAGGLYVLLAEADLPAGADVDGLGSRLGEVAARLGVEASLRPVERDDL